MPSPFPGMDPYLESRKFFPDLHDSLIFCLQGALHAILPANYYATKGARVWIETTGKHLQPDIDVFRQNNPPLLRTGNGVAVLKESEARPVQIHVPDEEIRETFLDIFRNDGEERLITSIEVLSPSNKAPGEKGHKLYRRKQHAMRRNHVNLVEIDLLRSGQHTTSIPEIIVRQRTGEFDYHVCIRLGHSPLDFHVYPILLKDRLPKIAIPLVPSDPLMTIDLQAVFEKAYENGAYERRVSYVEKAPLPPLKTEYAEGAAALLRDKGLLPPAQPTS